MTMLQTGIIPDPWLATTVTIPAARCGPPGVANGGWVCGTVAGHLGAGPVEVTLRAPTPLDLPLELRAADDHATLSLGDELLVSAKRSPGTVRAPAPVDWSHARVAETRFLGHRHHPFPGCFVCGPRRAAGDGLRIFPGPVAGAPGTVATVFTPQPSHAGPHGRLSPAAVWAALDCPTGWATFAEGEVALLGRLRAEVRGDLRPNEPYLVVAEASGRDGRKIFGRAAIYHRDGRMLAASEAIWISLLADG
jgi:hypothetical protein